MSPGEGGGQGRGVSPWEGWARARAERGESWGGMGQGRGVSDSIDTHRLV